MLLFIFVKFYIIKKLNNHVNHIKNQIFPYMLYFEFFKMSLNYKNEKTLYVIFYFLKTTLNYKTEETL